MSKKSTVWVSANDLTEEETLGVLGLARQKLVKNGECLEWGFGKTSGNGHAVKLKTVDPNHTYKVYTLDVLMKQAGKEVSPVSLYRRTCNNPRCMNTEHCYPKPADYPQGEQSSQYQHDYKLAVRMLQNGWALGDIAASTSKVVLNVVKTAGVDYSTDVAKRHPLSYFELLKVAEYLRKVGNKDLNIKEVVVGAGVEFERLAVNGAAIKALCRRDLDTVVWLLSLLCEGFPMNKACEYVGKNFMYGAQLFGACYGY